MITGMDSIQQFLIAITYFIGNVIIPFLFGVALLVFIFNVARYFIIGGDNEANRAKAKQLALYAILAFVFLVSIWGIVNMFVYAFDIGGSYPVGSDYIESQQPSWFDIGFSIGFDWAFNGGGNDTGVWDGARGLDSY